MVGIATETLSSTLTDEEAILLRKNPAVKSVTKNIEESGDYNKRVFPHDSQYPWSQDNYGPLYIPKKGETVALNHINLCLFSRHLIKRIRT